MTTANTVRLLVVFAVAPLNHDDPLKFMVGRPLRPLLMMVGVPVAVALHPSPDLSFHVAIGSPFAAGIPVAFGSAASNHNVGFPGNADGNPNDGTVLAEVAEPDMVAISRVPFCTKDEILMGTTAVTDAKVVDGRDTFPPDDAVTVSV
jgi:hypothetical protein